MNNQERYARDGLRAIVGLALSSNQVSPLILKLVLEQLSACMQVSPEKLAALTEADKKAIISS